MASDGVQKLMESLLVAIREITHAKLGGRRRRPTTSLLAWHTQKVQDNILE